MYGEKHFTLSETEKMSLLTLAKSYDRNMRLYYDTDKVINEILPEIRKIIPADILSVIKDMKNGSGPELITIGNLPVDDHLPDAESLEQKVAEKTRVSETCLVGINALLEGKFQEEKSSHQLGFIHQVTPVKKFLGEASGRGGGSIPFHAENMFVDKNPSILSLFCLQGEAGVETEYLYVSDIIKYLDKETLEVLKRPIFTIVSGDGFDRKYLYKASVLDHREADWRVCRFYEEDRIFSDYKEGTDAVEKLHHAINRARDKDLKSVELSGGTLLLFSNATRKNHHGGVLHGRRGDMSIKRSPEKKSGQRWLQRVCVELAYH